MEEDRNPKRVDLIKEGIILGIDLRIALDVSVRLVLR